MVRAVERVRIQAGFEEGVPVDVTLEPGQVAVLPFVPRGGVEKKGASSGGEGGMYVRDHLRDGSLRLV